MSNNVDFQDYSLNVKNVIKEKAIAFLHEVGGEIRSVTTRNSRRKTSHTAGSYDYKVDEDQLAVHIGSDYKNAIWEEFGTGEFAEKGDGRKGYWVYVENGVSTSTGEEGTGKSLTLNEAKRVMAILRSKGLNAFYTKGKTANKPLQRAFESTRPKVEAYVKKTFGDI